MEWEDRNEQRGMSCLLDVDGSERSVDRKLKISRTFAEFYAHGSDVEPTVVYWRDVANVMKVDTDGLVIEMRKGQGKNLRLRKVHRRDVVYQKMLDAIDREVALDGSRSRKRESGRVRDLIKSRMSTVDNFKQHGAEGNCDENSQRGSDELHQRQRNHGPAGPADVEWTVKKRLTSDSLSIETSSSTLLLSGKPVFPFKMINRETSPLDVDLNDASLSPSPFVILATMFVFVVLILMLIGVRGLIEEVDIQSRISNQVTHNIVDRQSNSMQ